ncbi:hypothetical protein [Methylobacterium iners]|uniref:N-acetyltransferase domain-containing protein n=1 Tax=Methylobacterium iners TaxID=418707 RepID=A0ABQ4RRG9_9HYPH|nr:hypothetical protein [Methylobacterium iners]GJD92935.1 hypothetical protein OCOJLMKI_0118 [Methylobacterium iners]
MVSIGPTTAEDVEVFLAEPPAWRIRAMTARIDGAPVAIGGLSYLPDGTVVAFLEGYAAVKRYPVAVHKAVRQGLADAARRGVRRIVTIADEGVEAAPRWLQRLGFREVSANVYVWEA